MQPGDLDLIEQTVFRLQIHHLAADHAMRPGGARQGGDQIDDHARVGMGRLAGQHVEGIGQQPVAGENGGRLVIGPVRRRPAAAQIVVVHRRQIVVHQAVAMHHLYGRTGAQGPVFGNVEQRRALHGQEGTQPLAAVQRGVPHRLGKARFAVLRYGQQPVERLFDFDPGPVQLRVQIDG